MQRPVYAKDARRTIRHCGRNGVGDGESVAGVYAESTAMLASMRVRPVLGT